MNNIKNVEYIPKHTNCTNCGKCCGPVLMGEREYKTIKDYCIKNNIKPFFRLDNTCYFRDEENKKCLIYKVRPVICKLFGVAKGMKCVNGNTCEIDGYKYIPKSSKIFSMFRLAKELEGKLGE